MDSDSDSSVDSVCWGPYTMKEARADIKKGKPRQIDRRHSCVAKYQYFDTVERESPSTTYVTASTSFAPSEVHEDDEKPLESSSIITVSSDSSFSSVFDEPEDKQVRVFDNSLEGTSPEREQATNDYINTEMSASVSYKCDVDNSDDLNNTFDGINRFDEPKDKQVHVFDNSLEGTSPQRAQFTSENDYSNTEMSASFSYKCDLDKSDTSDDLNNTFDEINKLLGQAQVSSPPSTPLKHLNVNKTKVVSKSDSKVPVPTFKIPFKTVSHKKPPNLKNIVSPVGVYIKHSPRYCPLVKVSNPKVSARLFPPNYIPVKENIPQQGEEFVIPPAVYKPAKERKVIEQATAKLPESIDKLVRPNMVFKHEGRIVGRQRHDQSIERRLMESNFSINDTQFDQDISILTQKAPFEM